MARRIRLHTWSAVAAAAILAVTATIHGAGYPTVSNAIGASHVAPALAPALYAVWLMISFHLVILGVVAVVASGAPRGGRVVLACALMPAADTLVLLRFVGLFVGTLLTAAATILLVVSGVLHPAARAPDE